MTNEQIRQEAEEGSRGSSMYEVAFFKGAKWMQTQPNSVIGEIEELRDDIEKCTETLDLIKDSDIIQMYGSIIGRLNLILNQ